MTDKERLEEAKLMAEMLRVETRLPHDFPFVLVDWLVEQAERVQELESDSYNAHLERLLDRREQQNERYREALKNIYDLVEYNEYDNTLEQIVSEVEKALEELE